MERQIDTHIYTPFKAAPKALLLPQEKVNTQLKPPQQLYKQEDANGMSSSLLPGCPVSIRFLFVNPPLISLCLLPLFDICIVVINISIINNLVIILSCSF